jgi:16S rRNA (guanine527-N7)-methyltransferase
MDALKDGARALGVELDEAQLRAFRVYEDELLAWNRKFNLTAITGRAEIVSKHFLDSLSALTIVQPPTSNLQSPAFSLQPPTSNLHVLDVGSGAGFPALPLKIACPHWRVTLLEATRKKCDFLEHVVITLPLYDTRVLWGRAETVGHLGGERGQYDLVVARAVAELNVLAEFMLPFARVGGQCIAWKGDHIEDEINAARLAIEKLGGRLSAVHAVQVPGIAGMRHLLVIEKVGPPPDQYPRREGVPSKRPIK